MPVEAMAHFEVVDAVTIDALRRAAPVGRDKLRAPRIV